MMAAPAVRLVLRKLRRFNMVIPNVAQEYANLLSRSPVQGKLLRRSIPCRDCATLPTAARAAWL
jgi:hypothetical protein